jgi:hypothetical protein
MIDSIFGLFLRPFVSSMRRLQRPPNWRAMPKLRQIDLAANVQISVRLRRKASYNPLISARREISGYDFANEIRRFACGVIFSAHGKPGFLNGIRPIGKEESGGMCSALRNASPHE